MHLRNFGRCLVVIRLSILDGQQFPVALVAPVPANQRFDRFDRPYRSVFAGISTHPLKSVVR
jgi:hypothetical protein